MPEYFLTVVIKLIKSDKLSPGTIPQLKLLSKKLQAQIMYSVSIIIYAEVRLLNKRTLMQKFKSQYLKFIPTILQPLHHVGY